MKTVFVSAENFKSIDDVLELSPAKIVLLAEKAKLGEALAIKDAFALKHGLPAEVAPADNLEEVFRALEITASVLADKPENADAALAANSAVCVLEHSPRAYDALTSAFVLGLPVMVKNENGWETLPTPTSGLRQTLAPIQLRLLKKLTEPRTHEQLLLDLGLDPKLLFYHLYENGRGLVKLGLVSDSQDKLDLTRLGRLVAGLNNTP